MGEPIYTAETWADSSARWHWRTLKDGKQVGRGTMATILTAISGVATREAAIEQARLDMEWDRASGKQEIVLNSETNPDPPEPETKTEQIDRAPGLYVVMTRPPGPDSEFVELDVLSQDVGSTSEFLR